MVYWSLLWLTFLIQTFAVAPTIGELHQQLVTHWRASACVWNFKCNFAPQIEIKKIDFFGLVHRRMNPKELTLQLERPHM